MSPETLKAIDATQEASQRGRWIYFVIQVASILIFMALWHETPFAWSGSRVQTARLVSWYLDCKEEKHPEQAGFVGDMLSQQEKHDRCHYFNNTSFSDKDVERAKKYLEQTKLTPAEARARLKDLQKAQVEQIVNVSVPFLGISFDIDDLSLLGGITFLLLLMWFRFSVWREEQNVQALFLRARRDKELPAVYELLAMTQVLTTPPGSKEGFWGDLPHGLFWVPVLVQLSVVVNDWVTMGSGLIVNDKMTFFDLGVGTGILGILLTVTLQCRAIARRLDQHWQGAFEEKTALEKRDKE